MSTRTAMRQRLLADAVMRGRAMAEDAMTQTNNPLLDQFTKLMTDVAGLAQGAQREVATLMKSQGE